MLDYSYRIKTNNASSRAGMAHSDYYNDDDDLVIRLDAYNDYLIRDYKLGRLLYCLYSSATLSHNGEYLKFDDESVSELLRVIDMKAYEAVFSELCEQEEEERKVAEFGEFKEDIMGGTEERGDK